MDAAPTHPPATTTARISVAGAVVSLCLGLGLVLVAASSQADPGYPPPADPYVSDLASLLEPPEADELRRILADLQRHSDVDLVVATVPSYRGYGTGDASFETFATGLFNHWGIGQQGSDRGVLILVDRDERQIRIELGAGYGRDLDAAVQRVIDLHVLPHLRRDEPGRGLLAGARATGLLLAPGWTPPARAAAPPSPPTPPARSRPSAGPPAEQPPSAKTPRAASPARTPTPLYTPAPSSPQRTWAKLRAPLSVFLLLLLAVLALYLRFRRRRCPGCGAPMDKLAESKDDAHLDSGQRTEEAVASVDYEVWQCHRCDEQRVVSRRSWWSRYESCPTCGYRTLENRASLVRRPTYLMEGARRLTRTCVHCDYRTERLVAVPRLTRSDDDDEPFFLSSGTSSRSSSHSSRSSSRSSYRGGRSSGGGASGKW